jgi:hypothetical protein
MILQRLCIHQSPIAATNNLDDAASVVGAISHLG